ncbi:acyltransferase family protein, partial [Selenomonas sp. oral taxon 126]|uniref:acyltransferase family protein n=1 Tax=Selenomonas sp. oral taxon 126 TaxID=712528 RepID=UPI001C12AB37
MSNAVRNNSLDLLRIIAMMMIISMHYVGHGGGDTAVYGSVANLEAWLIKSFVSVGVNCYILITGYFLINSLQFSFTKIVRIWGSLFIYSMAGFFLFFAMGDFEWSWKDFLKA